MLLESACSRSTPWAVQRGSLSEKKALSVNWSFIFKEPASPWRALPQTELHQNTGRNDRPAEEELSKSRRNVNVPDKNNKRTSRRPSVIVDHLVDKRPPTPYLSDNADGNASVVKNEDKVVRSSVLYPPETSADGIRSDTPDPTADPSAFEAAKKHELLTHS
ncbi:hypothetical protein CYMTET_27659, partial [Cymbomonas tetramitiformis]